MFVLFGGSVPRATGRLGRDVGSACEDLQLQPIHGPVSEGTCKTSLPDLPLESCQTGLLIPTSKGGWWVGWLAGWMDGGTNHSWLRLL